VSVAARILRDAAKRRTRLSELGVDEADLRSAVEFGLSEASRWTPNDPPTARGMFKWARTVGALRDAMTKRGWRRIDEENYPRIMRPDGVVAIAVSSGDVGTGTVRNPRTPPRGAASKNVIDRNQGLLADFASDADYPRDGRDAEAETWLLLYYEDDRAGETRSELALPVGMEVDGSIASWSERIVLDPISHRPEPITEPDETIDVEVKRRTG
jgi:hypothetical protein